MEPVIWFINLLPTNSKYTHFHALIKKFFDDKFVKPAFNEAVIVIFIIWNVMQFLIYLNTKDAKLYGIGWLKISYISSSL